MKLRTLPCRVHGGNFSVPVKRGRPPVKCGGEYPTCTKAGENAKPRESRSAKSGWCRCDEQGNEPHERGIEGCKYADDSVAVQEAADRKSYIKRVAREDRERREAPYRVAAAEKPRTAVQNARVEPQKTKARAVPCEAALAAKKSLEAQGWTVNGRAWIDPVEIAPGETLGGVYCTEIMAARGEERITINWRGDKLVDQQYSMWDMEQPQNNDMPEKGLSSEFDEYTDRELVSAMAGQKVTWWNKLGKNKETAYCPDSVKIVHVYNGIGDETPADRVVTIVDHGGTGFRSFRVGQLLKIG